MSAKEMFERLGYKLVYKNGLVKKFKREKNVDNNFLNIKNIEFGLNHITVKEMLFDNEGNLINDTIISTIFDEELQAINKQVEELGWIDNETK